jgi:hypothetical protein
MTNLLLDLTFAKGYDVELRDELPGDGTKLLYVPSCDGGGKDGLLLDVRPVAAGDWIGCFAFGPFDTGLSAVIASPQPGRLFLISEGAGYLLNTADAAEWEEVACMPVREAKVVADHNMVLFSDFTNIAAYGCDGLIWKSRRLCWDDLQISSIVDNRLFGSGYDPTNSVKPRDNFMLDLRTGKVLESDFNYAYKQHLL